MARSLTTDFAALRRCREHPDDPATRKTLAKYTRSKIALLVQRAAEIVNEQQLRELTPELVSAYTRLLENPTKSDPGCVGKTAICQTLRYLDFDDNDFFLAGIRYTQFEPCFGGWEDRAGQLRAESALALIQLAHPGVMSLLVDLMHDRDKTARAGAVRAVAFADRSESQLLLRMKAWAGDAEPEVMGEVFTGLLSVAAAEDSMDVIERYLMGTEIALACEAAIALGESRSIQAVPALWNCYQRRGGGEAGRAVLSALALTQREEAVDHLLTVVQQGPAESAVWAVESLALCRDDGSLHKRLETILDTVDQRQIWEAFRKHFPHTNVE